MLITVEYHDDLKEVQSDPRLAALLSTSAQSAPFDRLEWWQGLERHCGLKPVLAVARDGAAMAVLPLQAESGRFSALSNWYNFRFRPVISAEANGAKLLEAIAADLAKRGHRLTLTGLPDEDGSASLLARAFRQAGWIGEKTICDTNHILHVGERSYEEYIASRPGQLRTTLKRKSGKVDTTVLSRFDAAIWQDYEDIYAHSWKPSEGSPMFLRAFAEAEGEAGRLRLAVAHAEGQAVAAQMWTVEGGTAFIHKLAHLESAKPLSPGSVLSAALFRQVIDIDRVSLVDFGTGDNPYKRDWMEEVRPRYRIDMLRPLAPRNWPFFARAGLRRLAGNNKHV